MKANDELFRKVRAMSGDIQNLAAIVQNDITLTKEMVNKWWRYANEKHDELYQLIEEIVEYLVSELKKEPFQRIKEDNNV